MTINGVEVGDRLRIIKSSDRWFTAGKTYTVKEFHKRLTDGKMYPLVRDDDGDLASVDDDSEYEVIGKTKSPFKLGDRVKYVSGHYSEGKSNPLWNGYYGKVKGTVIEYIHDGNWVRVKWDNGTKNTYKPKDLQLLHNTSTPAPSSRKPLPPLSVEDHDFSAFSYATRPKVGKN